MRNQIKSHTFVTGSSVIKDSFFLSHMMKWRICYVCWPHSDLCRETNSIRAFSPIPDTFACDLLIIWTLVSYWLNDCSRQDGLQACVGCAQTPNSLHVGLTFHGPKKLILKNPSTNVAKLWTFPLTPQLFSRTFAPPHPPPFLMDFCCMFLAFLGYV